MRWVRFGVAVVGLVGIVSTADAQMMKKRGGDEKQQGFQGEKPAQKEEKRFPLGAAWVAVSLNGKTFSGADRPSFSLDESFRMRGYGGCNTFSATAFPLKEQGLAVGPLAMTRRACDGAVMANEKSFFVAIRTAAKWESSAGSLVIRSPNGELRFERQL